jgi:ferredoxin--NADP+ reductase
MPDPTREPTPVGAAATPALPELRVGVVGAGPAGFYAAVELLRAPGLDCRVDMFDRLPTPYGLVRHGVAPDHLKIKSVARTYEAGVGAAGTRFRLFGNVQVGRDVALAELLERYDAVVLAIGAQSDRRLGIPGEELGGVHPASVFVAWYNGHPDCAGARFDLGAERAVVVGHGNVALDVARMLCRTPEELAKSDAPDAVVRALSGSRVREVLLLGRAGPAQASFTPAELGELAHLRAADFVVEPHERDLDPESRTRFDAGLFDARVEKNVRIVQTEARAEAQAGRKAIRMRFCVSPIEILGEQRVSAVRLRRNRVSYGQDGSEQIEPFGETEDVACGIVLRSIGYRVVPIAGIPYDEQQSRIPQDRGQVIDRDGGDPVPGLFVTGWAKRGPQGVIGTNKPDAAETVARLIEAHRGGALPRPRVRGPDADVARLLASRSVAYVTFSDWRLLDQLELELGRADGRPRRKFSDAASMLAALAEAKMGATFEGSLVSRGGA